MIGIFYDLDILADQSHQQVGNSCLQIHTNYVAGVDHKAPKLVDNLGQPVENPLLIFPMKTLHLLI